MYWLVIDDPPTRTNTHRALAIAIVDIFLCRSCDGDGKKENMFAGLVGSIASTSSAAAAAAAAAAQEFPSNDNGYRPSKRRTH